jgi:ribonuclease P protein component
VALNRALRLRKNSEFQRVRQQGRVIASRLLILAYAPNNGEAIHVGFVVSKRVSKRAVQRNYIKRSLAEAVRGLIPSLQPGWDLVISAKPQIIGVRPAVFSQDVSFLLRRARLLTSAPMKEVKGGE